MNHILIAAALAAMIASPAAADMSLDEAAN